MGSGAASVFVGVAVDERHEMVLLKGRFEEKWR